MSLQTQTYNPNTLRHFVVFQDGQLNETYTDAIIEAERRQKALEMAHTAVSMMSRATLASIKLIGQGTLNIVDELVNSVN